MEYDVIIVGGGAAGFFAAIQIAEQQPLYKVAILERGKEVLTKVKISGGGRCNVTHAEFTPNEFVKSYPRGEKELRGPFHNFCSGDTIEFFEKQGISLKTEEDGRMFPTTNSSQTIIDCFLSATHKLGVVVLKGHAVKSISKRNDETWELITNQGVFRSHKLLVTAGGNTKVWKMMKDLGHSIISPVPSLFTFHIKDNRINNLPGIAEEVSIKVLNTKLETEGSLLITHSGISGPSVLKLSAWGARILNDLDYKFKIEVNWLFLLQLEEIEDTIDRFKSSNSKKFVVNTKIFEISRRLWLMMVKTSGISETIRWADVSKKQIEKLIKQLTQSTFEVNGKSTFKEEFVTAGGIDLKEVNFKTFESKKHTNLYFAGEVLNIDAITGGFNFQNAWTGAYLAAKAITS